MNISVLIRLMPATRTGGRLAGQAEIVETGQTFVFAGDEEMIALLDRVATGAVEAGALSPGRGTSPGPDANGSTSTSATHSPSS